MKKVRLIILSVLILSLVMPSGIFAKTQDDIDIKVIDLNVNLNKDSLIDSKSNQHPIFSKGNQYYFNIDSKGLENINEGTLNLSLEVKPDEKQEDQYKIISTKGTINLDKQEYPIEGEGLLQKYNLNSGQSLYVGNIKATYKIKSENVYGSMFVAYSEDENESYISATVGTIGHEQALVVFGTNFKAYDEWVKSKVVETKQKTEIEDNSNIKAAGSNEFELAAYGTDNTTNQLNYPYTVSQNPYPVIYVHAYSRDPRSSGGNDGSEKVRVIGQESYVKDLYQVETSEFSNTTIEFWWNEHGVATIDEVFPQSNTVTTAYLSIFASLFPNPISLIAQLGLNLNISSPTNTISNTNGDLFNNYSRNDMSVGNSTSDIKRGTSGYNSVDTNAGTLAWFRYYQTDAINSSWGAFVRADADFYLTYTSASGLTHSMLVRSDPVTLSHRIYKH